MSPAVSQQDLQQFLSGVEEADLETVLTSYTTAHPSSALFLGEVKHEDINSLIKRRDVKVSHGELHDEGGLVDRGRGCQANAGVCRFLPIKGPILCTGLKLAKNFP